MTRYERSLAWAVIGGGTIVALALAALVMVVTGAWHL